MSVVSGHTDMSFTSSRVPLGVPGIYQYRESPAPMGTPSRMDVCAFVGVAPRGPCRVPVVDAGYPDDHRMVAADRPRRRSVAVKVDSFDEYRRHFGAFEGPGMLPYAVAAFFEQGGRRAYIVRIVHQYDGDAINASKIARGELPGFKPSLTLRARNEGSWGNSVTVEISFTARPLAIAGKAGDILVERGSPVAAGTLLRFTLKGDNSRQLRWCRGVLPNHNTEEAVTRLQLQLDSALPAEAGAAEIIEAQLTLQDGSGYVERWRELGLSAAHGRYLADVLCRESILVWPDKTWAGTDLLPAETDAESLVGQSVTLANGADDYSVIDYDDFFDAAWTPGDDTPGAGIFSLAGTEEVTHLVVPDLYQPSQWVKTDDPLADTRVDSAGACFAPCVSTGECAEAPVAATPQLPLLVLDPRRGEDLDKIVGYQLRVVEFAETTGELVALLDVPPGLNPTQIERWRTRFDSGYAAAYYPWCEVSRRDDRYDELRAVPPSAVAAGIIARRELAYGIPWGPANELAYETVKLSDMLSPAAMDRLHPIGINLYAMERDGIRLIGARTLSRDRQWRQLSVRRLVLMLRRVLWQDMQWAVFEPNGPRLWAELQNMLENFLRRLWRQGAFSGASEKECFFVRVLHDQALRDAAEVVVEMGIAPTEPLEYIVVRLIRDGDGTLRLEE